MAIVSQKKVLNLIPGYSAPVTVHVSFGDHGTTIEFILMSGDEPFDASGLTVTVHGVREDGANFGPIACLNNHADHSRISFETITAMTNHEGSAIAEVVLVNSSGDKVGSANFAIMVEDSAFPLGVTYNNDASVYEAILAYVQSLQPKIMSDVALAIDVVENDLGSEISARVSGDSDLSSAIATERARIDAIASLPEGSTTGDAELIDIRIGTGGSTYADAGTSVRRQISGVTQAIKDVTGMKLIDNWTIDHFINTSGSTVENKDTPASSSSHYSCAVVQCQAGDAFTISGSGGSSARLWAFIDSNDNVLTPKAAASATASGLVITAPEDAAYLILNNNASDANSYKGTYRDPKSSTISIPNHYKFVFGNYVTSGTESQGYKTASSDTTFGMNSIVKAEKPIVIRKKANNNVTLGVTAFEYDSENDKIINQKPLTWFSDTAKSVSIPSGCYYWIGFRDGNDPCRLSIEDIAKNFEIFESDNNIGFGSSKDNSMINAHNSVMCNINIEYAYEDLIIIPDGNSPIYYTLVLFDSDGFNSEIVSAWYSIKGKRIIKKGSYYRLHANFNKFANFSDLLYSEAISYYRKYIKVIPYKDENILSNFGNYSITNGNTVPETATFGMSFVAKAEKPVTLFVKSSASTNGITAYVAIYSFNSETNNYDRLKYYTWNSENNVTIPSGYYYWIGFKDGNDPCQLSTEDIIDNFEIIECEKNIGYGDISDTGVLTSDNSGRRIVTPNIEYSDKNYLVTCDFSNYTISYAIYSGDVAVTGVGSYVRKTISNNFVIQKNTYYRLVLVLKNGTFQSYNDAEKAMDSVKLLPFDNYGNDAKDIVGAKSLIYNLATRIDNLERINSVNTIPSYYQSHIESKVNTINSLRPEHGKQFAFITDIHINGYNNGNQKHSHALLNYICNNTTIDMVVNGGDSLNGTDTLQDSVKAIREAVSYAQPDFNVDQYYVVGNHDGGEDYNGQGEVTKTRKVMPELLSKISGVYSIADDVVYDPKNPFQYYFDKNGIRFIVLGIGEKDLAHDEGWFNSYAFYIKALLDTPDNYHIVVFNHKSGYSSSSANLIDEEYYKYLFKPLDAYKDRDILTFSSIRADFSNVTGVPVCLIFGHSHIDRQGLSDNDIPWFITTTDNANAEKNESQLDRTIGTVSEQAFDVFTIDTENRTINITRIGAGSDRSISY